MKYAVKNSLDKDISYCVTANISSVFLKVKDNSGFIGVLSLASRYFP